MWSLDCCLLLSVLVDLCPVVSLLRDPRLIIHHNPSLLIGVFLLLSLECWGSLLSFPYERDGRNLEKAPTEDADNVIGVRVGFPRP